MNGNRICLLDLVKGRKGLFTYVGDLVVATSKSSCRCWGSRSNKGPRLNILKLSISLDSFCCREQFCCLPQKVALNLES